MESFQFPYKVASKYSKKVAYFSSEFAIDQSLKIYSGGLGFLAGSHMRSAYDLKQQLVGVGMLWQYGYYDQIRNADASLGVSFIKKQYSFLQDAGVQVSIKAFDKEILIRAKYLDPKEFGTAPMFLLTTDVEGNSDDIKELTARLYDHDPIIRIMQYMVLGIGGAKILEAVGYTPQIYHLNEAHPLSLCFYLLSKYKNFEEVHDKVIFTTHTPEEAGNEKTDLQLIKSSGFLCDISDNLLSRLVTPADKVFNHSLVALRIARLANGVSKLHGEVANDMWRGIPGVCPIISITNAQNKKYWKDTQLEDYLQQGDSKGIAFRKREMKKELFKLVADQCGKRFDPDVLTIVWARRFAGYKRANLILSDLERFRKMVQDSDKPIQVIWAGKPYPFDQSAIDMFNAIIATTKDMARCAVLIGYELNLSAMLKKGSDVWLNNPRIKREASGTSGMTAAMNASVNLSINDGWVPEFAIHGHNAYIIGHIDDDKLNMDQKDKMEASNLYSILENEIIPAYYDDQDRWQQVVMNSMSEVVPMFDSGRMADEYYEKMYKA